MRPGRDQAGHVRAAQMLAGRRLDVRPSNRTNHATTHCILDLLTAGVGAGWLAFDRSSVAHRQRGKHDDHDETGETLQHQPILTQDRIEGNRPRLTGL